MIMMINSFNDFSASPPISFSSLDISLLVMFTELYFDELQHLGSVVTTFPTDQQISGSITRSYQRNFPPKELFHLMYAQGFSCNLYIFCSVLYSEKAPALC